MYSRQTYQALFSQMMLHSIFCFLTTPLRKRFLSPFRFLPSINFITLKSPPKVPTNIFLPRAEPNLYLQKSRSDKGFLQYFSTILG